VDSQVALINVVISCISIGLLTLIMFQDNVGTLMTVCPLETLCLPPLREGKTPPPKMRAVVGRALTCVVLQFFYSLRCAVMPAMCSLASSLIFAASDNALDLVLNSIAVGFIVRRRHSLAHVPILTLSYHPS